MLELLLQHLGNANGHNRLVVHFSSSLVDFSIISRQVVDLSRSSSCIWLRSGRLKSSCDVSIHPDQSSSGLQRPDQPSVSKKSSPEQQVKSSTTPVTSGGRKLSLKEKRKLRAEKVAENIDLQAASHGGATPTTNMTLNGGIEKVRIM